MKSEVPWLKEEQTLGFLYTPHLSHKSQTGAGITLDPVPRIEFFHFPALYLSLQVSLRSTFVENHPGVSHCPVIFLGNST